MDVDVRKYTIILTLAVLISIFIFSVAEATTTDPEYPSICTEAQDNNKYELYPRTAPTDQCQNTTRPTQERIDACPGQLNLNYNTCEYECSCYEITQQHREQEERRIFWIATILAGISIIVGMLLPAKKSLNEWIGSGLILAGVASLFIATMRYWGELDKLARPIVIAIEIAIVLWIAYKKFSKE